MKKKNNTNYKYIIVIGTLSFTTLLYFVFNKKYFFVGGEDGVNTDGTLTDAKMQQLKGYITSHIDLADELLELYLKLKSTVSQLQIEIESLKKNTKKSELSLSTLQNQIDNLNSEKEKNKNNKQKLDEIEEQIDKAVLTKQSIETGKSNEAVSVDSIGLNVSNEKINNLQQINATLEKQLSTLKSKIMDLGGNEVKVRNKLKEADKN